MADQPDQARLATLAISMGDPGGVGPEVLVKALAEPAVRRRLRVRIHGPAAPMHDAARHAGIEPFWWRTSPDESMQAATSAHEVVVIEPDIADDGAWPAQPTRRSGELSFRCVQAAIEDTQRPAGDPLRADAIVTAPISKKAWTLAGKGKYPGHTELLANRYAAKRVAMMFVSPQLRVVLATAHIPLMHLRNALTIGRVFDTIDLAHAAGIELGMAAPRIGVCGVNPHAGEEGLLGDEDQRLVRPAIELAQQQDIDARGPFPADTLFHRALAGSFDLVVAMYHDQGLIPVKLIAFDRAVNTTLGLGVPRTSPDHGTAFDIAGLNKADPGSMTAAIRLAARLAQHRRDPQLAPAPQK